MFCRQRGRRLGENSDGHHRQETFVSRVDFVMRPIFYRRRILLCLLDFLSAFLVRTSSKDPWAISQSRSEKRANADHVISPIGGVTSVDDSHL